MDAPPITIHQTYISSTRVGKNLGHALVVPMTSLSQQGTVILKFVQYNIHFFTTIRDERKIDV
jgi:hypothetical protein